jgi:general secretion pathway protein H
MITSGIFTHQRGFTLIELLVVVVIIGVVVSMFTLAVGLAGGSDRELRREAERLDALLRLGLEDAQFQGRELGIRFFPDHYEFSTYDPGNPKDRKSPPAWRLLPDDSPLAGRKLPEAFEFQLRIDGREVNLARSARDVKKKYQPQLFLFSSGDISDGFEVELRERNADRAYLVTVTPEGTIEVERDGA